jgi:hypothetical protein
MTVAGALTEHIALLDHFLHHRPEIVDRIAQLLNARRVDGYAHLQRQLTATFFDLPGLPPELARLNGELQARRIADGFEPIPVKNISNGVLDPVEFIGRAYDHWEYSGRPGRNIRTTYAHTVYAMFMLKRLEDVSLLMLEQPADQTEDCLRDVQSLLDRMNQTGIANVPVFVKDARWLILTAQSAATQHVRPYFNIAQRLSRSLTETDRLAVHQADAKMIGGHLRSQLRYQTTERRAAIDDLDILAYTRTSNAMDHALLVYDLVPLLEAYETAGLARDTAAKQQLADAILQGISAGPELFLADRHLLAPCTILEDLFVEHDAGGGPRYTTLGEAHMERLSRYSELIGRLANSLEADAADFAPSPDGYSPYGISYGFASEILGNMAMRALIARSSVEFSLEDAFVASPSSDTRLAWTTPWKSAFYEEGERAIVAYSQEFAEQVHRRLTGALHALTTTGDQPHPPHGRLFVVPSSVTVGSLPVEVVPEGAVPADEFVYSTANEDPEHDIAFDRKEGRCLVSYESGGEWVGLSKSVLTYVTGQGRDALITVLSQNAIEILRLTCPGVVVL